MSRYFTSDLHFNSTLINQYANRPVKTALNAGIFLVNNANSVLKKEDLLIHVGDFCLTSPDRHGTEEDIPIDISPEHWMSQFKSRLVLLAGNHDDGHSFEADCKSMVLDLNQNYRNVSVSHYPSYHKLFASPDDNCWKWRDAQKMYVHIHLCGHVHDSWLLNYDKVMNVLNVNVGTDVWNYKPVRDSEITEMLDYVFREREFKFSWQHTRVEFNAWKKNNDLLLAALRDQRRAEKLLKKGLTPEICQQRKEEALRKKGLLT